MTFQGQGQALAQGKQTCIGIIDAIMYVVTHCCK